MLSIYPAIFYKEKNGAVVCDGNEKGRFELSLDMW